MMDLTLEQTIWMNKQKFMPFTKADKTKGESLEKDELFSVFICGAVGVILAVTFGVKIWIWN